MLRSLAVSSLLAGCDLVMGLERKDLPVDAAPGVDADVTPIEGCPSTYDISIPTSRSRYRFITTAEEYGNQRAACLDDPQMTHLLKLESATEAVTLDPLLDGLNAADTTFWIGLKQDPTATAPDLRWFWVSGGAIDPTLWRDGQPDDADGSENHEQDGGAFNADGTLSFVEDRGLGALLPAICECDGEPSLP